MIPYRVLQSSLMEFTCPGLGPASRRSGTMLAKLSSYTLVGIDAAPVEVEVDVSSASMPKTVLVGLAEAAVRESTHRVERALVNSGYRRPDRSGRDQPRPGRSQEGRRRVRPADRAGDAAGQRPGRASSGPGDFAVVGELALDRRDPADQGGAGDGPGGGRRGERRPARPRGQRRRGGRRRGDRRLSRSAASPRRSASSPGSSTSTPRPSTSTRSSARARTTRTTSSTSRGRTTPSGPC